MKFEDFKDYARIIDEQKQEIKQLRVALSQIAHIVGGAVLPTASLQFITEEVEKEVELVVTDLRADNEHLRKRIEKLSKRKPTEKEAVAQLNMQNKDIDDYILKKMFESAEADNQKAERACLMRAERILNK